MIFKPVTVPQSASVSNFFDTEGKPIIGLTKTLAVFDGTTEFALQTPALGADHLNPAAAWVPVLEPGVGARAVDAAGAAAAENTRNAFGILTGIFDVAGSDANFFLFPNPQVPLKSFAATDVTATSMGEAEGQALSNAFAYSFNKQPTPRLPNILRVNLTNSQTTAAVTFQIALAEPALFKRGDAPRFVDVTFLNGDADSSFFELAPGERVIGIQTPAAFTTTDLNFQTVKPGLDPVIITDANWLNIVNAVAMRAAAAGAHIWQWIGAAQAQYVAVSELEQYLELPKFLRLHGSGNQGAQRVVRVFIQ
jgi:hypothetical protein